MVFSLVSAARRAGLAVVFGVSSLCQAAPAIAAPSISVNDVTISEGNGTAKTAVFTVSLSAPSSEEVGFYVSTAEASAIGNDDFEHYYSSRYTIPAGQTTYALNLVIFGDTVVETDETFNVLLEGVTGATVAKGVGIGTIVNDDAGAAPTLSIGNLWTTEGASGTTTANFVVQLSQPAATDVSFSVATANGTAAAGSDYTAVSLSNQVIPAGQLRKTIPVNITGDTSAERDETFLVNLSGVSGATPGRSQGVGTIGNDDAVSAVKIYVGDAFVQERSSGPQIATFYVQLTQPAASTVTFDFKTEDSSATAGSDYGAVSLAGLTIPAGQTSRTVNVTVNGDTLEEPGERFIVTLSNISTNASVLYNDPHGVGTIPNDDATLSVGDVTQLEGSSGQGTAFLFPVTVSSPLYSTTSFQVETVDGTASALAGDFEGKSGSNWQLPGGASQVNVVVWVTGDTRMEPDETFTLRISSADIPIADNEGLGTILNDDAPPFPSLYVNDASKAEGNSGTSVMNFIITMSETAFGPVSFDCRTEFLSAVPGVDYVAVPPTRFTIPAGEDRGYFPVTIYGDTTVEYDGMFYLVCDNISGGKFTNGVGLGKILNDDSVVFPAVSLGDLTITETDGFELAFIPITLSSPAPTQLSFYVWLRDGTALGGLDFTPAEEVSVTIPAGATSGSAGVTIVGDTLGESTETFEAYLGNVGQMTVGRGTATVTIQDNDGTPVPNLSINDVSMLEGRGDVRTARFTVSLSEPAAVPVTFDLQTVDESADAPFDYKALPATSKTIPVGDYGLTVSVPVYGDLVNEGDETFRVQISNLKGANPHKLKGRGTIRNDDAPAGPRLSISDASLAEGNAGTQWMAFTVSLSQPATQDVSFKLATVDAGASASADYIPLDNIIGVIAAGQTSKTVSVGVLGDALREANEVFLVELSNPQGGATILDGSGLGTIIDDDLPTGPSLSVGDVSIVEGNAGTQQATFTVTLSAATGGAVSFDIATAAGTAAPGADFLSASAVGKTIAAGQTSASFAVTINGDTDVEDNETFTVNLSNAVGAELADAQARGTISNDDLATLSIADATLAEGNEGVSTARFAITLSHPLPTPVVFDISTANASATAGSDYVARGEVARVLDPGRTRAVFEVQVNGDAVSEPDEDFGVSLSNVVGAVLADGSAIGTIQNDDAGALTPIASIQGTGAVSPLLGQEVATEGVVTAITAEGFFLQSSAGQDDGDPLTSEGVFVVAVETGSVAPAAGDRLRVHGRVQEVAASKDHGASTQTQLIADGMTLLGRGLQLPSPTLLQGEERSATAATGNGLERLEGMRIAIPQLKVLAPSGGSIDERTSRVRSDGRFHGAVRASDGIVHPLRIVSAGQSGAMVLTADRGDVATGLVGVLRDGDGPFELLPDPSTEVRVASRARPTAVSRALPSEATIGSFNLRRLLDDVHDSDEPVLAAGAYAVRLAKLANALCVYAGAPAMLAVQEVENEQALGDLAAAVNARAGNVLFDGACGRDPGYVALRDTARAGSRMGLLVSTAEVSPGVPRVEVRNVSSQAVADTFGWRDGGRELLFESPPLRVQARINGEGGQSLDIGLIVAQFGEFDARSGSAAHGWSTATDYLSSRRAAQARALAQLIRAQQREHPAIPLVVLVDSDALPAALGLSDPASHPTAAPFYSVIRDGRPEALDRVWLDQVLLAPAFGARVEFARINADFGEDHYGDPGVPMRVSDHDPLVLFLRMR